MKHPFCFAPLAALLFAFFLSPFSCRAQTSTYAISLGTGHVALLLDSADAAIAITTDRRDRYFEIVTASEMSIQMKQPLTDGQTRESLLPTYIRFLKSDVEGFTAQDVEFVEGILKKMFKTVGEVNTSIFPDTLIMIKTKGTHYGESVWYTRDNCIVVPKNELENRKTNAFASTMYHELFHVYSRLNPSKREKLYQLIGFQKIGLGNLHLPPGLAERVLYNPDGVDFAQKITLKTETAGTGGGGVIEAVPIIYAKSVGAKEGQKEFFGYLEFNIFQILPNDGGSWRVVTKDDGYSSTLKLDELPDFFRQIKDNTGYIIHPDEVLADNFSFIMAEKNNPQYTAKFSAEGKKLLKDVEAVLR